ncbi:RHS repeat-associated core domain-containing protein [Flavobacterium fontis]|uniref:RHS repeat-associated core domain-containing protein n=1 Tax=Flavobacterium fontis TaxID=1124188 RepID=A0A1M4WXY6_9FLAO|nr:RHS repeat-associated core domain-containing protein [Flavobacterium fontis]SHE86096.1 RHS repeat-associated core domain-containing protein [Flavobacterium fontis]
MAEQRGQHYYNSPYKFNGKELDEETGLYYYGARYYNPKVSIWLSVDPHAERYPSWSPYNFVFNNPLIFIDPDGRDPIYGKNFWGNVKLIGDDGKTDGKSYLVRGDVKKDVKAATKEGQNYTGALIEGKNVMNIPTGGVMDDVVNSVNDTEKSGKENGGHSFIGDANATRWDEGPAAQPYKDQEGNEGARAQLIMFKINGKTQKPKDASNMEFWWHVHPNVTINGVSLGSSNPTDPADFNGQKSVQSIGFKGNSFVIGVRTGTVTFFTVDSKGNNKILMTVKYSDFKKMGGK